MGTGTELEEAKINCLHETRELIYFGVIMSHVAVSAARVSRILYAAAVLPVVECDKAIILLHSPRFTTASLKTHTARTFFSEAPEY